MVGFLCCGIGEAQFQSDALGLLLAERVGPIVPFQDSVTGTMHVKTLRRYAVPTLKCMFPTDDGLFQEDNTTPHKSKVADAFRKHARLCVLTWPAQSPDLNPIENLWAEVKRNLRNRKRKPTNLLQLRCYVKDTWKAIPKITIENIVDSMPSRIVAVIAAQGVPTKY